MEGRLRQLVKSSVFVRNLTPRLIKLYKCANRLVSDKNSAGLIVHIVL